MGSLQRRAGGTSSELRTQQSLPTVSMNCNVLMLPAGGAQRVLCKVTIRFVVFAMQWETKMAARILKRFSKNLGQIWIKEGDPSTVRRRFWMLVCGPVLLGADANCSLQQLECLTCHFTGSHLHIRSKHLTGPNFDSAGCLLPVHPSPGRTGLC